MPTPSNQRGDSKAILLAQQPIAHPTRGNSVNFQHLTQKRDNLRPILSIFCAGFDDFGRNWSVICRILSDGNQGLARTWVGLDPYLGRA